MSELKACPFCGSKNLRDYMEWNRSPHPYRNQPGVRGSAISIMCEDCGAVGPETPFELSEDNTQYVNHTKAWNLRA